MDHVTDLLSTAHDLCITAAFRLAARQKVRWAFLIDRAAELLAERARRYRVRCGDSITPPGTYQ